VAASGDESPKPQRETVIFPKLKPPRPAQHRRKPSAEERAFEGTQQINRKATWPQKYCKQYQGKHRKGK
jgi:hypothetical protein